MTAFPRSGRGQEQDGPLAADAAKLLAGRRVLLGRSRPADPFVQALSEAGAEVDALALTCTAPGAAEEVEQARFLLESLWPEWLVVTSAQTLEVLDLSLLAASPRAGATPRAGCLPDSSSASRSQEGCSLVPLPRLAAVGPRTAHALAAVTGRQPDVVGDSDAEALAQALEEAGVGPGTRVLLPQSALARPVLAERLAELGSQVRRAAVYTTVPVPASSLPPAFSTHWRAGAWDAVVLTAGSAARALVDLAGPAPTRTAVVALGRPTQQAAQAVGLRVATVAPAPTAGGVLRAVSQALNHSEGKAAAPSPGQGQDPPP